MQSRMFFVFAVSAFLATVITYKLSNMFENLYNDKQLDTEDVFDIKNVDLGNVLCMIKKKKKYLTIIYFYYIITYSYAFEKR